MDASSISLAGLVLDGLVLAESNHPRPESISLDGLVLAGSMPVGQCMASIVRSTGCSTARSLWVGQTLQVRLEGTWLGLHPDSTWIVRMVTLCGTSRQPSPSFRLRFRLKIDLARLKIDLIQWLLPRCLFNTLLFLSHPADSLILLHDDLAVLPKSLLPPPCI
jgi:hypothetical protein